MVPLNLLSSLMSRPQLVIKLSRNLSTTGRLFGCGCRQSREDCPPKKCETKVSRARRKCKPMDCFQSGKAGGSSLPEFCSKTALTEFSWKMQELQKNWELIAAQMEKDCEARGYKKDQKESDRPECRVKPPKKEEADPSGAIFVVIAALLLAALVGYYIYLEYQKKEEEDKKKDGNGKKEDGKKEDGKKEDGKKEDGKKVDEKKEDEKKPENPK